MTSRHHDDGSAASPRGGPLAGAFQIYAPSTIYAIGLGAMMPAVATAALDFGAAPALAAAVVVLIGVGGLLMNGPAALLVSRVGERRTIIASAFLGAVAALLAWGTTSRWHLAAGLPEEAGLPLLLSAVLMVGAAGSGFNLARQSYLAAAVPVSHRARAMSMLGGTIRIGTLVGPFLGAGLQSWMGLPGAFAAATVAMAVGVGMSFFIDELAQEEVALDTQGIPLPAETLRHMAVTHVRLLSTVGLCVMTLSATRVCRAAVIPLWAAHLGIDPATTSLIFGLSAVVDVLMFYPSGWLMDRYGRRAVAVPCLGVMAVGFAVLPLTDSFPTLLGAALLVGLGNGFGSGIVMTLGADYSPGHGRAQFLGIWRIVSDSGMVTGPLLLSAVTGLIGLPGGILALAGLAAAGSLGFRVLLPGGPGSVHRPQGGRGSRGRR